MDSAATLIPCTPASLPVRGAWIEILDPERHCYIIKVSLPVRGAWIEMFYGRTQSEALAVAPRAGSVD